MTENAMNAGQAAKAVDSRDAERLTKRVRELQDKLVAANKRIAALEAGKRRKRK